MTKFLLFAVSAASHFAFAASSCGDLLQDAIDSALDGALITQEALRAGEFSRETKLDGSLVTTADLEVSAKIVDRLTQNSGLPVLSEESLAPDISELMQWKRFWIIDPIDGTENFARKGDDFSILIALMERPVPNGPAHPILGIIGRPAEHKIYFGSENVGSWEMDTRDHNLEPKRLLASRASGKLIVTSQKETQAMIGTTSPGNTFEIKRIGGNGAKFIALASGQIDCYFAQPMKWWDIAAGDALYRYAVQDGEQRRSSPLVYIPHLDSELFYQERGFILGDHCTDAEVNKQMMRILNRNLDGSQ
jgi:3'(2'), 5'-bisphosphate nucleotidase